jgi:hypothetical protein
MKTTVRPDRRASRRGLAALSIVTMAMAGTVPLLELDGAALGVAIGSTVIAALLQAGYAISDAGTLAPAVVFGLVPAVVGETDASFPRVTALIGGLLVFAAIELGQLALDQRTRVPIAADPPSREARSIVMMAGLGALAGLVTLGLWATDLPPSGVLAALGAVAVVALAAVVAHPAAMLRGRPTSDGVDDDEPVSLPPAAPGAGR